MEDRAPEASERGWPKHDPDNPNVMTGVTLTAWESSRSMYRCAGTVCKDQAIYPGELVRFRLTTREPLCQDCGGWPR